MDIQKACQKIEDHLKNGADKLGCFNAIVACGIDESIAQCADCPHVLSMLWANSDKDISENKLRQRREHRLFNACHYGKINTLKYFIDSGVDIKIDNGFALCAAARQNRLEIMEVLFAEGFTNYDKALSWAVQENAPDAAKVLLEKGADPHSVSDIIKRYCTINSKRHDVTALEILEEWIKKNG